MTDIGATLREARMRRRIDINEVEQATKIRAKYLRAMEDEEWHQLPGPTFVKSFLRTYADYLGLDSRLLLEEWKRRNERVSEAELPPLGPRRSTARGRSAPRPPGRWRGIVLGLCVVLILVAGLYVLGTTGKQNDNAPVTPVTTSTSGRKPAHAKKHRRAAPSTVRLRIVPTAPVYVCLVDERGRKVIPGITLNPGAASRTYVARAFRMNLGNSAATLTVDGKRVPLPASGSGIGLQVTPKGHKPLPSGQRPTCA